MATKSVLITGANTGIGLEVVRALCSSDQSYQIIVSGRSIAKVQDATIAIEKEFPSSQSKLIPVEIDICDDQSIRAAFQTVQSKFPKLDALINNAGGSFDHYLASSEMTERQIWNQSWNTNTVGTQIMTSTFMPLLIQSSDPRLLFVTSGTSSLTRTDDMAIPVNHSPAKGWPKAGFSVPAYRASKCGMNMMMREWHRLLKEDGVKVWSISPGFLATGLGGNPQALRKMGAGHPSVAGEFIRDVLEGQRDKDVGTVITKDGVQEW
ncbi:hypothetical protein N7466_005874 [Penicillium verhagenii]|uniref:uncharacterized protein n=1 Tax=Penicillium verhagenii TaxID=1562060 RepID=UPI0025457288|nr:uncharacterized protein N7466_005874 [Penicillium verhagenii]KAJ5930381.1 hypothetical protein N7466_005874 [Penicillium verhagenii]